MTQIYIIDDYTSFPIWDSIRERLGELETSPYTGDQKPFKTTQKPTGDWQLRYAMHQHASSAAYEKAGIREPKFEELPCVFAVRENGGKRTVHELCKAHDTSNSLAFISRILGLNRTMKTTEDNEVAAAFEKLGRMVFAKAAELVADGDCDEWAEEIMEMAVPLALAKREIYSPALHGEINAEPGTAIWSWRHLPEGWDAGL
jgi:hypothetical protein